MSLVAVVVKVPREVIELAEEMVKLGIARSRNHAFNIMLEIGLVEAKRLVERRKNVRKLVEKFLREGLPYRNLPTAADVEEARSR